MSQKLLRDASLYRALLKIDHELAAEAQAAGCPCGGRLHSARYPRKPRGALALLPPGYRWRESFCCDREGCRRRRTPPSVRFLGRRVYLGVVVVLLSALVHGATPARLRRLRRATGACRRTVERWRRWWIATFVTTPVWQDARARVVGLATERLPASLLASFGGDERSRALHCLVFLAPVTSESCSDGARILRGFEIPQEVSTRLP